MRLRSCRLTEQSRLDCSYSWLIHTFINLEGRGAWSCVAWLSCTFVRYASTCICFGPLASHCQKIYMAAVTRTLLRSPTMPLYTPLSLRSSCSMSDGLKHTSLASLWYARVRTLSYSLINSRCFVQGGGILAAFTSFFPDLVDSNVALIAPTGLVEVTHVIYLLRG